MSLNEDIIIYIGMFNYIFIVQYVHVVYMTCL